MFAWPEKKTVQVNSIAHSALGLVSIIIYFVYIITGRRYVLNILYLLGLIYFNAMLIQHIIKF